MALNRPGVDDSAQRIGRDGIAGRAVEINQRDLSTIHKHSTEIRHRRAINPSIGRAANFKGGARIDLDKTGRPILETTATKGIARIDAQRARPGENRTAIDERAVSAGAKVSGAVA